ncbi:MAG: hypothetical protein HY784_12255 [Chloroflexi bacterium]|nr:hypothetical protein [Chloroflexota bacterium]
MRQVTLTIPDELAERLNPYWEDLALVLGIGVGEMERTSPGSMETPHERAVRVLKQKHLAQPLEAAIFRQYASDVDSIVRTAPIRVGGPPASEWIIAQRNWLRGYDAVQLAAALTVAPVLAAGGFGPLVFVAADRELLAAAQAEGLATADPNEH